MQLVRTSLNLRSDLRWAEDAYEKGIFAWINGSKNSATKKKNYEAILRILPPRIDFVKEPNKKFKFAGESLEYESFSFDGKDYLGFLFTNTQLGRSWNTRVAFCRNTKHVQCFVSLECDLQKGASLPSISKPKILDYLIKFQDGDGGLDITDKPHIIEYNDISKAKCALTAKLGNVLPIVYLSCSERTHSLKPSEVAKKLFGVAHVLAEKDKTIYERLRIDMKGANYPKRGEIGICYQGQPIDIFNRYSVVDWSENPETLVQDIFLKILKKNLSLKFNFTWDDFLDAQTKFTVEQTEKERLAKIQTVEKMRNELAASKSTTEELSKQVKKLMQELEAISKERDQYKDEHARYIMLEKLYKSCKEERDSWENLAIQSDDKRIAAEKELADAKQSLHNTNVKNAALEKNFNTASSKNVQNLPLVMPKDIQMFPDEYKCQLISILRLAQKNVRKTTISPKMRTADIIEKILAANVNAMNCYEEMNKNKEILESVAKQQNLNSSDGTKAMKPFNMEIVKKGNNHGKIRFVKDESESFLGSEASTASETARGGKNQAADLVKAMLWSD